MINDSTKRELWKSGEGRCARCGRPLVYEETVIDHIFPKSLGGPFVKSKCTKKQKYFL